MQVSDSFSPAARPASQAPRCVVVIGAATGGPQALSQLLPQIPAGFPGAIMVVQHIRPGFTRVLAEQLGPVCSLPVLVLQDRQPLSASRIFITSSASRIVALNGGAELFIEEITEGPEATGNRIDATMTSAARLFGPDTVGVLLTGLGTDGREGMRAIRNAGGSTIAQDKASSVVFALPSSAIDLGVVDEVLPLWEMAGGIIAAVGGETDAVAA